MRNGPPLFSRPAERGRPCATQPGGCGRAGMTTRSRGVQLPTVQVRFGQRIRELRGMQRLSQAALAEQAGLSYKFVGEIERGIGNPTLKTIASLASALQCDLGDLLVRDGTSSGTAVPAPDAARLERAVRILQSVLTPRSRRRRGRS